MPKPTKGPRLGGGPAHERLLLANLAAARIDLLVVTPSVPEDGSFNRADRAGFPIERGWADAHPESFTPLYGAAEMDANFRIYRVHAATSESLK